MLPVKRWSKRISVNVVLVLLILSLVSCGKKANPIIPVTILPKGVEALSYQVKGRSLLVLWDIPKQNTDGSPIKDLTGFKVQKGEWPTRDFCATCPDQFQETLWINLKGPELPDVLIDQEQIRLTFNNLRPGNSYLFQVTALSQGEKASTPSKTLKVAWDLPLMAPTGLQAKAKGQGLEISWEAVKTLVDGSAPEGLIGYSLFRRLNKGPWIKVNQEPIPGTSTVDEELQEGVSYTYQVKALRQIYGQRLESQGSEEKELVFSRLAPPPQVQELVALAGPKGIQIRWEGITTMTPSGYLVYKRKGNEKKAQKITPQAIRDTIFEDAQVTPGTAYFYAISAIGQPPALLEGPRSKEVGLVFNP
jgi:hypothetical protein